MKPEFISSPLGEPWTNEPEPPKRVGPNPFLQSSQTKQPSPSAPDPSVKIIEWRLRPEFHKPYHIDTDIKWTKLCEDKTPVLGTQADVDRLNADIHPQGANAQLMQYRLKP